MVCEITPLIPLAGAEGLEPSARGFGVDVGKALARSASRSGQPLADFGAFLCAGFDALLMLFETAARFLPHFSALFY